MMKKFFLSMVMMFLVAVLTTGCEIKIEYVKTDDKVTDYSQIAEESYEEEKKSNSFSTEAPQEIETADVEAISRPEGMYYYQEPMNAVTIQTIISQLDEEPEWSIDNFGSIESFYDFCSTMSIPKEITDIYDEHEKRGELNSDGELEFWQTSEEYAYYASAFNVYKEAETYRITKVFETYNAEEVIGQGCFRNGDDLIIISVLKFSNVTTWSLDKKMEYLPEYYNEIYRIKIGSDGRVSEETEYVDTALLVNRDFKKIMVCPEFTVIFYPNTSEFLCVKDSKPIGPRTKVDNIDIKGLHVQGSSDLGIINDKNTLVYPVIVKNDLGTSFELFHVADVNSIAQSINIPLWIKIREVRYPVVDGSTVYYVDGATKLDYEVSYSAYGFADDVLYQHPVTPIVVNSNKITINQYDIDYNDFQYELWDGGEGHCVCVEATNDDMTMWLRMISPESCIYYAMQENRFSEYITSDKTYKIPTYSEVQKIFKDLGISVEW